MRVILAAAWAEQILCKIDSRLLVPLCSLGGLVAWFGLAWLDLRVAAALIAVLGLGLGGIFWLQRLDKRGLIKTYVCFVAFWSLAQVFLQGLEIWPELIWPELIWTAPIWPALTGTLANGLRFALRLLSVGILILPVILCLTPIELGRVLVWYLTGLGRLESCLRSRLGKNPQPQLFARVWRAGLILGLMMSALPRCLREMRALAGNLRLRAPRLSAFSRGRLLGVAALRLLGQQSWDMALAVVSRGLDAPGPWAWRKAPDVGVMWE